MFARTLKTIVLATAVVAVTGSASMAASWGWMKKDSYVNPHHNNSGAPVNTVEEGQKVKVVAAHGKWYKLNIPGPNGWVRKHKVSPTPIASDPVFPGWGSDAPGGSFCINGEKASFCIGSSY
ncbi:hypothetical protein [Devosia sp.]|uniref:hypothetical protein n=1 Tax=Devosia sp. TaxID=1871048 RepID=UPI003A927F59